MKECNFFYFRIYLYYYYYKVCVSEVKCSKKLYSPCSIYRKLTVNHFKANFMMGLNMASFFIFAWPLTRYSAIYRGIYQSGYFKRYQKWQINKNVCNYKVLFIILKIILHWIQYGIVINNNDSIWKIKKNNNLLSFLISQRIKSDQNVKNNVIYELFTLYVKYKVNKLIN